MGNQGRSGGVPAAFKGFQRHSERFLAFQGRSNGSRSIPEVSDALQACSKGFQERSRGVSEDFKPFQRGIPGVSSSSR